MNEIVYCLVHNTFDCATACFHNTLTLTRFPFTRLHRFMLGVRFRSGVGSKFDPRGVSRCFQDGSAFRESPEPPADPPRIPPRRPKTAPRRSQDGPKAPQDGPRRAEDVPRRRQDGPRGPQDGPRRRQDAPRRPQDAPRGLQEASKERPKMPKSLISNIFLWILPF